MSESEAQKSAEGFHAALPNVGVSVRLLGPRAVTMAEAMMQSSAVTKSSDIGEPDITTGSNQVVRDDYATAFTNLGAIDPAYDPEMLTLLFEHSNSLRQNVDSYGVNIDGFGHRFDPVFDLESDMANQRLGDAMYTDRQRALDESVAPGETPPEAKYPSEAEIQDKRNEVTRIMRMERVKLAHFFEFCSPDSSFVTLRRKTRQDLEVTGNAYWEVLRNAAGQIVQFVYMVSFTMRLLPLDARHVVLRSKVRVSELSFDEVEHRVRMRRYVQVVEAQAVFFKELGDPRIISAQTGVVYDTIEAMKLQEPASTPAHELIHFRVHSSRSPYGVPRWIGNLLSVIGSRQAEEVNFNYFENKSVPPLAILVTGGRMTQESVERVTNHIEANIKGKRNFHKILVLEAESGEKGDSPNASKMRIDIKPLTGAQHNDALFQNYDERNIDKVGQSFRLPRMLRGDIRDFNRSTADAALVFAEMQVFEPERQEFDFIVNRKILAMLGIRFWRFVSLAPVMRDPVAMSEIIKNVMNANCLTPGEARELLGDVFNREFRKIGSDWTKQPPAMTIAGIPLQQDAPTSRPSAPGSPTRDPNWSEGGGGEEAVQRPPAEGIEARAPKLMKEAKRLIALQKALVAHAHEEWVGDLLRSAQGDVAQARPR